MRDIEVVIEFSELDKRGRERAKTLSRKNSRKFQIEGVFSKTFIGHSSSDAESLRIIDWVSKGIGQEPN